MKKRLTKFDMAYEMGYYRNLPWTIMCDAFSLLEMKSYYQEFINSKK